jgi:hypothetical protein
MANEATEDSVFFQHHQCDQIRNCKGLTFCPLVVPYFRPIIPPLFAPYLSLHFPLFPALIARFLRPQLPQASDARLSNSGAPSAT